MRPIGNLLKVEPKIFKYKQKINKTYGKNKFVREFKLRQNFANIAVKRSNYMTLIGST